MWSLSKVFPHLELRLPTLATLSALLSQQGAFPPCCDVSSMLCQLGACWGSADRGCWRGPGRLIEWEAVCSGCLSQCHLEGWVGPAAPGRSHFQFPPFRKQPLYFLLEIPAPVPRAPLPTLKTPVTDNSFPGLKVVVVSYSCHLCDSCVFNIYVYIYLITPFLIIDGKIISSGKINMQLWSSD